VTSASGPANAHGWIRLGGGYLTIEVAVRPEAPRSAIQRIDERGLVIAIAAAPEHGKANEELIRLVGKVAGVPRTAVSVLKGHSARRKVLRVETADPESCAARLRAAVSRRS